MMELVNEADLSSDDADQEAAPSSKANKKQQDGSEGFIEQVNQ